MNSRQRILSAFNSEPVDRTPIWFMRQAGRYLPEYRKLKAKYGFLKMAQTPELATEVTLQPLKRFNFDAAILFSDILVIPEALGQSYSFRDQGGIQMAFTLENEQQIQSLTPEAVEERLQYVPQALQLIKRELNGDKALLGFGGSPFTLAAYMVEGGSNHAFPRYQNTLKEQPAWLNALYEKLTQALITYFTLQIEAGADAIQIFDSWGHLCDSTQYWEYSLKWIEQIIAALPSHIPIILFAKHKQPPVTELLKTGASVLSLGPECSLKTIRNQTPGKYALQGNLNPDLLNGSTDDARNATHRLLNDMEGYPGHIFNLGHGLTPQAKIENIEAILEIVQSAQAAHV